MTTEESNSKIDLPIKKTTGETLQDRMNENAYDRILPTRYQMKNEKGEIKETQEELFERIASNVALGELPYLDQEIEITPKHIKVHASDKKRKNLTEEVFEKRIHPDEYDEEEHGEIKTTLTEKNVKHLEYDRLLEDLPENTKEKLKETKEEFQEKLEYLKFIPNTPTWINAGNELQQLSACFVLSPEDDMKDIHQKAEEAARIFQCLTSDHYVYEKNKGIKSIKNVKKGDKISQGGKNFSEVEEKYKFEKAPVIEIELENGITITGTPDHELFVEGKWIEISDIEEGMEMKYETGWIPDDVEDPNLESVEKGALWSENREFSNEEIIEEYEKGKSDYEIAETIGAGKSTIQRRRDQELELPPNGQGGRNKGSNKENLETVQKLHETGLTDGEIESKTEISKSSVRRARVQLGLECNGTPVNNVEQPESLTEGLAELVGLWVGDGSYHNDGIRFHNKREDVKERIIELSERLFGVTPSVRFSGGCYVTTINSHEIKRWWDKNFGEGKHDGSLNAKVPEPIKKSSKKSIQGFLKGLFTADGSSSSEDIYPNLSTASEKLSQDVLHLLSGLGIPAKKYNVTRDSDYDDLRKITVKTEEGRKKFYRNISFIYENENKILNKINSKDSYKYDYDKLEIVNIEEKGKKTVYDLTMSGNSYYMANSIKSHNSGGGCGYGFWKLRPYGDKVGSTGGISSGPISFMRTYDQVCATVEQGGSRRGAQMGIMKITHPDVIEFIHAKNKDVSLTHQLLLNDPDDFTHNNFGEALEEAREILDSYEGNKVPKHLRNAVEGHLSNFNISVGVTDDFMEAVYNDEDFTMVNPRDEEPHIATEHTKEMYSWFDMGEHVEVGEPLEVPARELWDRIIQGAHENGEPGVVYLERANKEHSFDYKKHPETEQLATNPCLSGDMKVSVADGRGEVRIDKLAEEDKVPVFTHNKEEGKIEVKNATAFKTKENVETIEIQTDGNTTLELTPDHEVYTNNRGKVEAQNLKPGDSLVILKEWNTDSIGGNDSEYRMLSSQGYRESEHRLIASHYSDKDIDDLVVHHKNHDGLDNRPENLEPMSQEKHREIHDIRGVNNPLYKLKEKGEFEEFKERSSFYDTEGKNNPMYGEDRKIRVDFECDECGDTIQVTPHEKQIRKYCSNECQYEARKKKTSYECTVCGDEIEAIPSIAERRRYCSRQCANKELDKNLTEEGRKKLEQKMIEENPMNNEEIAKKSAENTDYEELGEKVSETRKELIEKGELAKKEVETEDVMCRECGNTFSTITNTHLKSKHNMTTEEYKEKYPDAEFGSSGVTFVKNNHKVTSINKTESKKDVYDMTVPDTHNFYAGKNTLENQTTDQKCYVKLSNCGEQPLMEYEACNLGHLNLSTIVDEEAEFRDWREFDGEVDEFLEEAIDWEDFNDRIYTGTRFLDNVVTMSNFPVDRIEDTVSNNRKIGLGIMGLAQLYIQLGVKYGSDVGNDIVEELMVHINQKSKEVSHELAKEKGKFANWDKSKYSDPVEYKDWFEHHTGENAEDWEDGYPIRNHNTTTIAPTGTTSMVANTTGGCEPMYNVANFKNVSQDIQGDDMLSQVDDFFLRTLKENDIDAQKVVEQAMEQMNNNEFRGIDGLDLVPDELNELFVTTSDLSALEHAGVQCACQEGVDSAISKTVNAPEDASLEDTREAFEFVYDNGGKGVTYYRDGTRSKQVLTTRRDNKEFADEEDLLEAVREMVVGEEGGEFVDDLVDLIVQVSEEGYDNVLRNVIDELEDNLDESVYYTKSGGDSDESESGLDLSEYRKRDDVLVGATIRKSTPFGDTMYITLNEDSEGKLFEIFAEIGKSGGRMSSMTEGLSRMISMALRYGVPPERVVKHLSDIKGPEVVWDNDGNRIHSVPDAISLALEQYIEYGGVIGIIKEQRSLDDDEYLLDEVEQSDQDATREFSSGFNECPDCGGGIELIEGCEKCAESCGWSKC